MLAGKKILVAGAGGLLGSKLCKALLEQNAEVVAIDINPEVVLKKLSEQSIDVKNSNIQSIALDMNDEPKVQAFFEGLSGLDGVVNSMYPRNKQYGSRFEEVSLESFNQNTSLNIGSTFLLLKRCVAYFRKHQSPISVVNISSIYGMVAPDFSIYDETNMTMPVEYAAIKAAQQHLTRYVVNYVKNSRFRVNSVCPGGLYDAQPEPFLEAYRNKTHGTGMLDPGDINGSVIYLLSDLSKYVTGQQIIVDDGFTL
ncbi:oxidoreductase [Oceaniserpentilla sp. 4NH20-0058]|uniref:oxidoreductase n=1 Tax=Oceaniserpentilla sp. 4NH20-0058 TaxID=3127660 RepID=UPI003107ACA0